MEDFVIKVCILFKDEYYVTVHFIEITVYYALGFICTRKPKNKNYMTYFMWPGANHDISVLSYDW